MASVALSFLLGKWGLGAATKTRFEPLVRSYVNEWGGQATNYLCI